jgi:hypothetical protein
MRFLLMVVNPATLPSYKVCGNCQVGNVIICSMGDVHCNVCHSTSKVHKLGFFTVPLYPMMNLYYWPLKENGLKQMCI